MVLKNKGMRTGLQARERMNKALECTSRKCKLKYIPFFVFFFPHLLFVYSFLIMVGFFFHFSLIYFYALCLKSNKI